MLGLQTVASSCGRLDYARAVRKLAHVSPADWPWLITTKTGHSAQARALAEIVLYAVRVPIGMTRAPSRSRSR